MFVTGVAIIVIPGLFPALRPDVGEGAAAVPVSIALTIQMIMGAVGAIILLLPGGQGQ